MLDYDWNGSRLKLFLKKKSIPVVKAAEMLGVTRQTVYQYFDSDSLSRETVNKILKTFNVQEDDIFEARFLNDNVAQESTGNYELNGGFHNAFIDLQNGEVLMVTPLVEEYAQAGFLSGYSDTQFLKDLPNHSIVVNKFHRGRYFSFRVVGDSMNDGSHESIMPGSIVTAREIKKDLWRSKFHIHKFKDYVIVHEDGILVKRIIDHKVDEGVIICRSINNDKDSYPDFEINLDECKMILNIVNVSMNRS